MINQKQLIIDYSSLYKLFYTIANALGFEQACIEFLHEFTKIEFISFVSIWLKKDENYTLLDTYDVLNNGNGSIAKIDVSVVLNSGFAIYSEQDEAFEFLKHRKDIISGIYVIYNLNNIGCLHFYINDIDLFSNENWKQLKPIFE